MNGRGGGLNLWGLNPVSFTIFLQSLSGTINEGLTEGLVLGNGLQDGPLCCDVANGPLAQSSAT